MRTPKYSLAIAELLLVFPAVLFMTALFIREVQPQQYEPAHSAQQIVMWYAARPHVGLWILLIAFPFLVVTSGSIALWRKWREQPELREATCVAATAVRAHLSAVLIGGATLAAGGVLAVVALHVLTD